MHRYGSGVAVSMHVCVDGDAGMQVCVDEDCRPIGGQTKCENDQVNS